MDLAAARQLFPLVTAEGLRGLERIRQHPSAPRWTHLIGDHVRAEDLHVVDAFRGALASAPPQPRGGPPPPVLEWVSRTRARVPRWRAVVPEGSALERDWARLPTLRREDVAAHIEELVVPASPSSARPRRGARAPQLTPSEGRDSNPAVAPSIVHPVCVPRASTSLKTT